MGQVLIIDVELVCFTYKEIGSSKFCFLICLYTVSHRTVSWQTLTNNFNDANILAKGSIFCTDYPAFLFKESSNGHQKRLLIAVSYLLLHSSYIPIFT